MPLFATIEDAIHGKHNLEGPGQQHKAIAPEHCKRHEGYCMLYRDLLLLHSDSGNHLHLSSNPDEYAAKHRPY